MSSIKLFIMALVKAVIVLGLVGSAVAIRPSSKSCEDWSLSKDPTTFSTKIWSDKSGMSRAQSRVMLASNTIVDNFHQVTHQGDKPTSILGPGPERLSSLASLHPWPSLVPIGTQSWISSDVKTVTVGVSFSARDEDKKPRTARGPFENWKAAPSFSSSFSHHPFRSVHPSPHSMSTHPGGTHTRTEQMVDIGNKHHKSTKTKRVGDAEALGAPPHESHEWPKMHSAMPPAAFITPHDERGLEARSKSKCPTGSQLFQKFGVGNSDFDICCPDGFPSPTASLLPVPTAFVYNVYCFNGKGQSNPPWPPTSCRKATNMCHLDFWGCVYGQNCLT